MSLINILNTHNNYNILCCPWIWNMLLCCFWMCSYYYFMLLLGESSHYYETDVLFRYFVLLIDWTYCFVLHVNLSLLLFCDALGIMNTQTRHGSGVRYFPLMGKSCVRMRLRRLIQGTMPLPSNKILRESPAPSQETLPTLPTPVGSLPSINKDHCLAVAVVED